MMSSEPESNGDDTAPTIAYQPLVKPSESRFERLRKLGGGGMGQVWLARDMRLNRLVALKQPREDIPLDDDFRLRFEREAQAAARLRHPALCRIFDVAEFDGRPCIVMEYVEGESLGSLLRSRGVFEEAEAIRIVLAVGRGLAEAHALGVIHRDLKPGNIVLSAAGDPVVVDFGLAWLAQASSLTNPGQMLGTFAYMSPEQADGRDERNLPTTDVYSLGVVLYELLTGRPPFCGSPHEILAKLFTAQPVRPSAQREGLGSKIDAICLRCLAKQPADRFQSMSDLAAALQNLSTTPKPLFSPFSPQEALAARMAWAAYLGRDETFLSSVGIELVLIPPGEFEMGTSELVEDLVKAFPGTKPEYFEDEKPAHRVRITKPLYIGKHTVTRGQFGEFVKSTGYETEAERDGEGGWGWNEAEGKFEGRKPQYTWKNTGFPQTDSHPVVNVSWNDARKFVDWLTGLEMGGDCRLPTEAEWEYACRAGTTGRWFHGDLESGLAQVGNVADATAKAKLKNYQHWRYLQASDNAVFTAAVGSYSSNPFGLFDMHGNVWEWCQDWYDANQYVGAGRLSDDPTGPGTEQQYRVLRGGSWGDDPRNTRSAYRFWYTPSFRNDVTGFRVVFSPTTP